MTRTSFFVVSTLCTALLLPASGCGKKDKGTTNPDAAAETDADPLAELQAIPVEIQAEIDLVLQPITDVDVVIEQVTTMPTRLGVDAAALTGLAKASLDNGTVAVDLEIDADVKAEIETLLKTVNGIAIGLTKTPERAKDATVKIVGLGTKATALVGKLSAQFQAKLANPLLKAEAKASIQADLDLVMKVDADIKAMIGEAKATVTGVPALGTEALVKLTTAFAGGASAG